MLNGSFGMEKIVRVSRRRVQHGPILLFDEANRIIKEEINETSNKMSDFSGVKF